MKKVLLFLSLLLVGCSAHKDNALIMKNAKVLEIESDYLSVQTFDEGASYQKIMILISEYTKIDGDLSSLQVGDEIDIVADVKVMRSFPPKVNAFQITI